jgi:hypothetical protein
MPQIGPAAARTIVPAAQEVAVEVEAEIEAEVEAGAESAADAGWPVGPASPLPDIRSSVSAAAAGSRNRLKTEWTIRMVRGLPSLRWSNPGILSHSPAP